MREAEGARARAKIFNHNKRASSETMSMSLPPELGIGFVAAAEEHVHADVTLAASPVIGERFAGSSRCPSRAACSTIGKVSIK
jgi:hypothetical protein